MVDKAMGLSKALGKQAISKNHEGNLIVLTVNPELDNVASVGPNAKRLNRQKKCFLTTVLCQ